MSKVSNVARKFMNSMSKHSPEILTGIGIAGMITGTVLAIIATPKAVDIMADLKEKHKDDTDKKELSKDIIKKVGPMYVPTLVTEAVSVACIIGAQTVNLRRNAALATAYTLSESALKEYRSKVIDVIGEKKEQEVVDAIAADKIAKNPVNNCEVIITEKGNTLCYDSMSGRYFTSDIETIKQIENRLNKRMLSEMYISLNELYYEFGLRCTEQGNELGFNINDGLLEFTYSYQGAEDGRPCLVIGYRCQPRFGYGDLH